MNARSEDNSEIRATFRLKWLGNSQFYVRDIGSVRNRLCARDHIVRQDGKRAVLVYLTEDG